MTRVAGKWIFSVLCVVMILGCHNLQQKPTSQQMVAAQSRIYEEESVDQVLEASETIFKLADEWDFQMIREGNTLKANRYGMVLLFTAFLENWVVTAEPVPTGTKVNLSPEIATPGGYKIYPRDVGIYHLFFGRLDYLLGKSDQWMTCEDYEKRVRKEPTWGYDGYLCTFADDEIPEALRPTNTVDM